MEQEYAQYAVAVDTTENRRLPLCQNKKTQHQRYIQQQYESRPQETLLFPDSTENEVSILFRNILELGLCAAIYAVK